MNVQTVRSTDQPDQRNARRDAPHPRAVESTEAGSAMADDRREDILKDLPEEVKLLLQFEVLKELKRQNPLAMAERKERVGEHSWHLALSVLLLAEFASEPIDIARAALLAIVHDTVEAFVGDTFAFGPDVSGQWSREHQAMKGLKESFDSKAIHRLVDLWQEYEDQETSEARFVKGMDAFLPMVSSRRSSRRIGWTSWACCRGSAAHASSSSRHAVARRDSR